LRQNSKLIFMIYLLNILFFTFFILRVLTIFISAFNEKRLKDLGATEFGIQNSKLLIVFHFAFYAGCFAEKYLNHGDYADVLFFSGTGIYIFSILMLYYVIYAIRHVWTVKLLIAPKNYHQVNTNLLFKYIRHPNYYLNVLPELIGLSLIFHAWFTLLIGFPLYLIPLIRRIREEEKLMKAHFTSYS